MVTSLYQYRRFIWHRALADVRHRYAGTGLGVVWNVLHPLALIAVYSVVFSALMSARIEGVEHRFSARAPAGASYIIYLCAGLLPWLAFSECVMRGCSAFLENAAYLKKLPMPELVFVAQTASAATLSLAISFSLLAGVSLSMGLKPTWQWLLLPLPLVSLQALGFAFGLLCGTLNVFFRDIGQLLAVALQLLLWTVPVVYPARILPPWLLTALAWHPLMPPLEGIRDLFLFGRMPAVHTWVGMAAWPALALLIASTAFHRLKHEIRDLL